MLLLVENKNCVCFLLVVVVVYLLKQGLSYKALAGLELGRSR